MEPQPALDLQSADVLSGLYREFVGGNMYVEWRGDVEKFLTVVAAASMAERRSLEFQKCLWDENPISSAGQGKIPVDDALAGDAFRNWVATVSTTAVPREFDDAVKALEEIYNGFMDRLRPHVQGMPHLKIFRVLATFFSDDFTALASRRIVREVDVAMFGGAAPSIIAAQLRIARRLADVLGGPPRDLTERVRRLVFPWYLHERLAKNEPPRPPGGETGTPVTDFDPKLRELADRLLLPAPELHRIVELLKAKRQVIFYGPPGTGKTFVARALAEALVGPNGSVETVQFHASYAYEDFVEGYRPALVAGQPGFQLSPGPLKRIADEARKTQTTHVLVIDELNRSNVAKVFGELYYLLEYRNEEIALQYSSTGRFSLPANLWIIGTMNTADRSIALMDSALRRRFYFVPFFPDTPPIKGLLRRWLDRYKPELTWLAAVVDEANRRLDDRHMQIGPSHFMTANLAEAWIDIVWQHSILPYLEEQFFGEPDRLKEFDLGALRQIVMRPAVTE